MKIWLEGSPAATAPQLAFRKTAPGLSRILFVLPEKPEVLRVARYFLKSMFTMPSLEVWVLAETHQLRLPEFNPTSWLTYDGVADFSWWGWPRPEFLDRLDSRRFEAVIDLNPDFAWRPALIVRSLRTPLRVGFRTAKSADFFNLEICPRPGSFYEQGLVQLQQRLQLG